MTTTILLYNGTFDTVHYGLSIAATAAALEQPTHIFITMGAAHAFTYDGWHTMPLSSGVVTLPCQNGRELNDYYRRNNLATFEQLLDSCHALGVSFSVCDMALHAMHIPATSLITEPAITVTGLTRFIQLTQNISVISL